MEFFKNINNLNDLKVEYRKLVKKYHPDNFSGSDEIIKKINNEYSKLHSEFESGSDKTESEIKNNIKEFINIINKLIIYENIDIEICGTWIWVSGSTREIKEKLKELNFFWASKKKLWYWRDADYKSKNRNGEYTIETIRNIYGSTKVQNEKNTLKKSYIK